MAPTAPPRILALHGFTGSGADFDLLRDRTPDLRWDTIDLPGHGSNRADELNAGATVDVDGPRRFSVHAAAVDVIRRADAWGDEGLCVLMGYSMGGRVALRAALEAPEKFEALVLIGAHPGIDDPAARGQRASEDEARAQSIEKEGIMAFAKRWSQHPIIASQARIEPTYLDAMNVRRRSNDPGGIAASARWMGTGSMPPMWDRLPALTLPTWLVAGAEDHKYSAFVRRMHTLIPTSRVTLIPQAGHAAHLEAPDHFVAELGRFLDSLDPKTMPPRR